MRRHKSRIGILRGWVLRPIRRMRLDSAEFDRPRKGGSSKEVPLIHLKDSELYTVLSIPIRTPILIGWSGNIPDWSFDIVGFQSQVLADGISKKFSM